MVKRNLAEITFKDYKEANDCLDSLENSELNKNFIIAFIDSRSTICKGVITDWPYDIPSLWEEIREKEEVIKIEKMTRKVWDNETRTLTDKDTGNLIITTRGNKVRESINIFQNLRYGLKIRPYVEPVKQCFQCYRYGHIKAICKSEPRCVVCGNVAHSECTAVATCRNCDGTHKASSRECLVFLRNREVKIIMA